MNDPLAHVSSQHGRTPPQSANPAQPLLALAVVWSAVLAIAGGWLIGQLILKFGMYGAFALWGLGALGGFVSRKITRVPSQIVACLLVVACVVAFHLAESTWYHEKGLLPDGAGGRRDVTWPEALTLTPKFLWDHSPFGLAVGVVFTFFGAQSAYWQAGRRYRLVAIVEEP